MLRRCMKRPVFEKIKHRVTRMDHNLFDVIWPSLQKYQTLNNNNSYSSNQIISASSSRSMLDIDNDFDGIVVVPDYESYYVFSELLDPLIRNLHCVTATGELPDQPPPSFFFDPEELDENDNISDNITAIAGFDIDPTGKYISAGTIDACRNLEAFPLPLTLTINQLEETEKQITGVLIGAEVSLIMAEGSSEDEGGVYYTLNEVLERPSDIRMRLAAAGLLVPINETEMSDEKRLHGRHWPYGRGVYVASAGDVAVWVNVQDHLRIIACTSENKPGQIGKTYVRIAKILTILDKKFRFKRDKKLGFLSARPSAVGNTLRFSVIIKLQGLSKKMDNLKELCIVRGLKPMETMRSDTFKLSNQQCLSITELQTLQDFINAVVSIIGLEKEMILSNSMNIASLIVNMFKKKSSARKFRG
ncbi:arginine kinase [Microplitis demolitor]|uniref:arginine kinase n=1 Tax=Microplitis demolitor TaxID=69319 RepID=UPI00235B66B6|nr:arginine kinase [Microplitis demolitor]